MKKTPLQQLIRNLIELSESIPDDASMEDKWYRSGVREAIQQAKQILREERDEKIVRALTHCPKKDNS